MLHASVRTLRTFFSRFSFSCRAMRMMGKYVDEPSTHHDSRGESY